MRQGTKTACTTIAISTLLLLVGKPDSVPAQSGDELIPIYEAAIADINTHDLDQWLTFFSEDVAFDAVPTPPVLNGREEVKAYVGGVIQGFPDFQTSPLRILAAGNTVAVHELYTGTHQEAWMGIPATGNVNRSLALVIMEFQDGVAVRSTQYWDTFGMMVNLGVMPPPVLPALIPSVELLPPEPTGLSAIDAEAEAQRRWGTHDMVDYAKIIREDAQFLVNGMEFDRAGYITMQEFFFIAFPNLSMDVLRSLDMGDNWVLNEAVFNGTHQGPYFGVPATGVQMVNRVAWLSHHDNDGLMTYASFHWDDLGVLMQLGAIPGPAPTAVEVTNWASVKERVSQRE